MGTQRGVTRQCGWGGASEAASSTPLKESIPLDASCIPSSFLTSLGTTYQFVMGVLALISDSFLFSFNFLWGSASIHARSWEDPSDSFPFLECRVLQHSCARCFMVLFSKRPAGLNLLCPTGSLNFAVFCFLFDLPPPPCPPGFGEGGGVGWLLCFLFSVCMGWLKSVITGSYLHGIGWLTLVNGERQTNKLYSCTQNTFECELEWQLEAYYLNFRYVTEK